MAASYKKLFKLLIDREMKSKELAAKAGIKYNCPVSCVTLMDALLVLWTQTTFLLTQQDVR